MASLLQVAGLGGCYVDFFTAIGRDPSSHVTHVLVVFASQLAHRVAAHRLEKFIGRTHSRLQVSPMWLRL